MSIATITPNVAGSVAVTPKRIRSVPAQAPTTRACRAQCHTRRVRGSAGEFAAAHPRPTRQAPCGYQSPASLADRIRDQRVDAQRRKQQRKGSKATKQRATKRRGRHGFVHQLLQRLEFARADIRLNRCDRGAEDRCHRRHRHAGANHEIHRGDSPGSDELAGTPRYPRPARARDAGRRRQRRRSALPIGTDDLSNRVCRGPQASVPWFR